MADDAGAVLTDRAEGVLTINLNRPSLENALSPDMILALTRVFEASHDDRSVRAVLVKAKGRHFCAGGDLRDFEALLALPVAERRKAFARSMTIANAMIFAFAAIEVPIVVACHGAVAGGGLSFLLAADMVLADETARLSFSHQRIGLPPDGGISTWLPEAVGSRKASELVLTAATLDAEEAVRLGLLARVVEADQLQAEAAAMAIRFAQGPADAARAAKKLLRQGKLQTLAAHLDAERVGIIEAVGTPDFEEGVRAFLEHRRTQFPSAARQSSET